MPLPLKFFVAASAERVDIGFGLFAQPYPRALDRPDDTSGEIDRSAEDIAFFYLQGTDMDAGPQPEFRRSRIGAEPAGIVERRGDTMDAAMTLSPMVRIS